MRVGFPVEILESDDTVAGLAEAPASGADLLFRTCPEFVRARFPPAPSKLPVELEDPTDSVDVLCGTPVVDLLFDSLGLCLSSFARVVFVVLLLLLVTFLGFCVSEVFVSFDILLDRRLATFAGVGTFVCFLGDHEV